MITKKQLLEDIIDTNVKLSDVYDALQDQINDLNNTLNDLFTYLEVSRVDVDDKTGIGKVVSIRKKGKKK